MKYLTGVSNLIVEAYAATEPDLGLMVTPERSHQPHTLAAFECNGIGYDNGAFGAYVRGEPFNQARWLRGLERLLSSRTLFCVVPDVVGSHEQTVDMWQQHSPVIHAAGHTAAFVLQNGCTTLSDVPADAGAVFVGGDDEFKLSPVTAGVCWEAHADGRWVHMGRVNSSKRFLRAWAMGCDSADGTFMRFGPTPSMVAQVRAWFAAGRSQGSQLSVLDGPGVSA